MINAVHPYGHFVRFNKTALEGIIHDVFRLANADFVVCTMSSNICRLVYELKLAKQTSNLKLGDLQSLDTGTSLKYWFKLFSFCLSSRLVLGTVLEDND